MSSYIDLGETSNGGMYVEIDEQTNNDEVTGGGFVTDQVTNTINDAIAVAKQSIDSLSELDVSEVEVEFGVKIGVEAGLAFWAITKATSEANIKITAKWIRKDGRS